MLIIGKWVETKVAAEETICGKTVSDTKRRGWSTMRRPDKDYYHYERIEVLAKHLRQLLWVWEDRGLLLEVLVCKTFEAIRSF